MLALLTGCDGPRPVRVPTVTVALLSATMTSVPLRSTPTPVLPRPTATSVAPPALWRFQVGERRTFRACSNRRCNSFTEGTFTLIDTLWTKDTAIVRDAEVSRLDRYGFQGSKPPFDLYLVLGADVRSRETPIAELGRRGPVTDLYAKGRESWDDFGLRLEPVGIDAKEWDGWRQSIPASTLKTERIRALLGPTDAFVFGVWRVRLGVEYAVAWTSMNEPIAVPAPGTT